MGRKKEGLMQYILTEKEYNKIEERGKDLGETEAYRYIDNILYKLIEAPWNFNHCVELDQENWMKVVKLFREASRYPKA